MRSLVTIIFFLSPFTAWALGDEILDGLCSEHRGLISATDKEARLLLEGILQNRGQNFTSENENFLAAHVDRVQAAIGDLDRKLNRLPKGAHAWRSKAYGEAIARYKKTLEIVESIRTLKAQSPLWFARFRLNWFHLTSSGHRLSEQRVDLLTRGETAVRLLETEMGKNFKMNPSSSNNFFALGKIPSVSDLRVRKGQVLCRSRIASDLRLEKAATAVPPERLAEDPWCHSSGLNLTAIRNSQHLLSETGLNVMPHALPIEVDLGHRLPNPPVSQLETLGCMAFALTEQTQIEIHRRYLENFPPQISPWDTYAHMMQKEAKSCVRGSIHVIRRSGDTGVRNDELAKVLGRLYLNPVCTTSEDNRESVRFDQILCLKEIGSLEAEDLIALLAADQAVTVNVDSESAHYIDDWERVLPADSNISHVIAVVGYGEAVSPFTLKKELFFWVRDSLSQFPIQYRISARELLAHMIGLYKVNKISTIDR